MAPQNEQIISKLGKSYDKAKIMKKEKALLREINQLRQTNGNRLCAECGESQNGWASVTLGVFMCTNCSQIHRGLGAHISKVKSCMGTYIWCPDEIAAMKSMGNTRARVVFGGPVPAPLSIPQLDKIARDKYDRKLWYYPGGYQALEAAEKSKREVLAPQVQKEVIKPQQPQSEQRGVPNDTLFACFQDHHCELFPKDSEQRVTANVEKKNLLFTSEIAARDDKQCLPQQRDSRDEHCLLEELFASPSSECTAPFVPSTVASPTKKVELQVRHKSTNDDPFAFCQDIIKKELNQ